MAEVRTGTSTPAGACHLCGAPTTRNDVLCGSCGAELKPRRVVTAFRRRPSSVRLPGGGWTNVLATLGLELVGTLAFVFAISVRSDLVGLVSLAAFVGALVFGCIATFGRGQAVLVRVLGLLLGAVALFAIWALALLLLLSVK